MVSVSGLKPGIQTKSENWSFLDSCIWLPEAVRKWVSSCLSSAQLSANVDIVPYTV